MIRISKYLIAGVLPLLLFTLKGCVKNSAKCPACDKCTDFPEKNGMVLGGISQKEFQRLSPCFNPLNAREFLYVKKEGDTKSLVKFQLSDWTETVLLQNSEIIGQPRWGRNGWIVFAKKDLNIYLIKANGDSLRQITNAFANTNPSLMSLDRIYFGIGLETFPGITGNKVIDFFGNRLDSLKASEIGGTLGENDINSNDQIVSWYCSNDHCSIVYFDFPKKELFEVYRFKFSGREKLTGIAWHPNNEDIYFSTYRSGIFKINKTTRVKVQIRNGCDSRSYRYLSFAPDGKTLLVERVDASDFDNKKGDWTEEAKIVVMDPDGQNEGEVFK